jgi:hypothetical protein
MADMNDFERNVPTPAEEEPVVHGQLATLPSFTPTRFFEERVMSGVRRPLPPMLRRLKERFDEWVQSGRIWLTAGGIAAGSLIPTGIVIGLTITFWHEIGSFGSRVLGSVVPSAWAGMTSQLAEGVAAARDAIGTVVPTGGALVGVSAATVFVLGGCALGLYRTMKMNGAAGLESHATE